MNENGDNPELRAILARYWSSNIRIMAVLLTIWAIVGLGCGVLFADPLNSIKIGGYPLGFWFAQQGAIIVFVVLILIYAILLNKVDKAHHAEIEAKGLHVTERKAEGDDIAPAADADHNNAAGEESAQ